MDAGLKRELEAKVYAGERLTREDGVALFAGDDLAWLGRLAHHKRTGLHGARVTFHSGPAVTEPAGEPADWVEHLWALREDRELTSFSPSAPSAAPAEVLKIFAVSRLLLDVPHLTCRWDLLGFPVTQLALNFGADDLTAGAPPENQDDLLELIWDAGFQPVERDDRYQVVREFDGPTPLAERRSEPQKIWA